MRAGRPKGGGGGGGFVADNTVSQFDPLRRNESFVDDGVVLFLSTLPLA